MFKNKLPGRYKSAGQKTEMQLHLRHEPSYALDVRIVIHVWRSRGGFTMASPWFAGRKDS